MPDKSQRELISDALEIWAPTYPRRVTVRQYWADSRREASNMLLNAQHDGSNIPFISTYSFPDGHTKDGAIPEVDTLFIDFDFEDGDYDGDGDREAWRRDLSHLLVRARRVAKYLVDEDAIGWRASLSGHKGVHLFLDFPTMPQSLGNFPQFVGGVEEYASDLVEHIEGETRLSSLSDYVDVTSSDLGRLCRAPNTLHGSATEAFGEERYCVPVSIEELATIDVDKYEELTSEPREVPYSRREPNEDVGEVLRQYIATAPTSRHTRSTGRSTSTVDYSRIEDYKDDANENISLSDLEFLTSDRPCVWKFYERDDKYRYGEQSHYMEVFCIQELIEHNVPIDVIKDFLDSAPEYDEEYSEQRIKEVISRDYNRFSVEAILRNAPEFSGYDDCALCQRVIAQHDDLTAKF